MVLKLKIKRLSETAILPRQEHPGDCFDLFADKDMVINSHTAQIIPLGFAAELPEGYRAKVFARSSLPLKKSLVVSNSVGIIDEGYKNQWGLICHTLPRLPEIDTETAKNLSLDLETCVLLKDREVEIKKGDKIAQMHLEKIEDFVIEEVSELDMSRDRGGGYGSTGTK